jgi:RNA polymerase sigma factor (sigma-70 family)
MPQTSGLDLLTTFSSRGISIPAIVITGYADVPMAVRAIKSGAFDFLEKPFKQQHVLDVIQKAIAKDSRQREFDALRKTILQRLDLLTPRERKVMDLVIQGMTSKEIAATLGVMPKTIDVHRGKIIQKMKADSVADLIQMAIIAGILPTC